MGQQKKNHESMQKCGQCDRGPFKARGNHAVCLQQKGDGICTLKVDGYQK